MFTISASQLFVWIIIGGMAGAIVGMLVKRSRRGFGLLMNIVIGMLGAVIGSIVFDLLNIAIAPEITFSLNDLIASIVGSLILLGILVILRRTNVLPKQLR